ncbi:MAG: hypothetical protein Q8922_13400 [Bacteroidota bacterium]|nr:hypothetical protein [Bacteroidota bacterium]MDP4233870.1 hypothetical protein [Bacteroidota bacterium]MDP4243543.1 hypothetical protein [Bacteroidota bacterium]MDP4288918.1 hypothetical protein [Bacteroidota bacterium]
MMTIADINAIQNHPTAMDDIRTKLRASFSQAEVTDDQLDQALEQAQQLAPSTELGQLPSVPADPCGICKQAALQIYNAAIASIANLFILLRLAITAALELAYWWALQRCGPCPDPIAAPASGN